MKAFNKNISIENWLVSLDDLKIIYDFYQDRFPNEDIKIDVKTKNGFTHKPSTFENFKKDINDLLNKKEEIEEIHFWKSSSNGYIDLQIYFNKLGYVYFAIGSNDCLPSDIEDWCLASLSKIEKIKEKIESHDEVILKFLEEKNKKIVLDATGLLANEIKNTNFKDLNSVHIEKIVLHTVNGDSVEGNKNVTQESKYSVFKDILKWLIMVVVAYTIYRITGVNITNFYK